jgi:aspartate/tyrosine/aromatic aminotransferase
MGAIELAPPDPILGIAVAYKADTFEQKVDLGIGAYRTEEGHPYMFNAVR